MGASQNRDTFFNQFFEVAQQFGIPCQGKCKSIKYVRSVLLCGVNKLQVAKKTHHGCKVPMKSTKNQMNTVNRSISLTKVCITKLSLWMWYCTFTSLTDGYGAQQKCNVRKHIGHCVHRSLQTRPECFCLSITCYIKRCRPQTTIFVGSDIILDCHLCHVTGCFPSEFQMSI